MLSIPQPTNAELAYQSNFKPQFGQKVSPHLVWKISELVKVVHLGQHTVHVGLLKYSVHPRNNKTLEPVANLFLATCLVINLVTGFYSFLFLLHARSMNFRQLDSKTVQT